jgi:hypothetical protein
MLTPEVARLWFTTMSRDPLVQAELDFHAAKTALEGRISLLTAAVVGAHSDAAIDDARMAASSAFEHLLDVSIHRARLLMQTRAKAGGGR